MATDTRIAFLKTGKEWAEPAADPLALHSFYITGGTMTPDAASYVTRQADHDLLAALLTGEYCYVLNTRQMGKSSLSVRTIARLHEKGVRTVFLDLTRIGAQNVTAAQWYAGLMAETGRALHLRREFIAHNRENAELPPIQRFFRALREIALENDATPLVVFVDEIDAVRSLPFEVGEFFTAIRASYNQRAEDPILRRLTFCLLGVATPADLITDARVSPFNIGKRIPLRDFTPQEAAPLEQALPGGAATLSRVLYWTSGHPYLTQRLCRTLAETYPATPNAPRPSAAEVDQLCDALFLSKSARESDDNLAFVRNRLLGKENDLAALLHMYQQIRRGKTVRDDDTNPLCAVLRLSGVCKTEGDALKVRNRIYDRVFDKDWIVSHLPGAEIIRQKEAYRRGVLRATALSGAVAAGFGILSFVAMGYANRAETERLAARKEAKRADENARKFDSQRIEADNQRLEAVRQRFVAEEKTEAARRSNENAKKAEHKALTEATRADTRQKEAVAAQQRAVTFAEQRSEALREAKKRTAEAEGEREVNRRSLVRLSADKGITLARENDLTAATLYLAEARRLEALPLRPNPARDKVHSFRIAEILSQTPRLVNLWSLRGTRLLPGRAAGFTPDSRVIQETSPANGADFSLSLWEPESSATRELLIGNEARKNQRPVYISPEGDLVVTAESTGADAEVRVWAISGDGKKTATPLSPALKVGRLRETRPVALSAGGKRIAIRDAQDRIRVFETFTGKLLRERQGTPDSLGPCLSADGQALAYTQGPKNPYAPDTVYLVPVNGDSEDKTFARRQGVLGLCFDPAGKRLAMMMPNDIIIYERNLSDSKASGKSDGKQTYGFIYNDYGTALAFSPDGDRLAIGNAVGKVALYNFSQRRIERIFAAHQGSIRVMAFNADGSLLATGGADRRVRLSDTNTGEATAPPLRHAAELTYCVFSPDNRLLLTEDTGSSFRLWDISQRQVGRELALVNGANHFGEISYSPDSRLIIAVRNFGNAVISDAVTGAQVIPDLPARPFGDEPRPQRQASFSPDSRCVALLTGDGAAVYEARTGKRVAEFHHFSADAKKPISVRRILFTPDNREAVTADERGGVRFWNLASRQQVAVFPGRKGGLSDIALSPDGQQAALVTGAEVILWNRRTGKIVRCEGPTGWTPGDRLDFRPDSKALLCWGRGNMPAALSASSPRPAPCQVVLWDALTGRSLLHLSHTDMVNNAAFSPTGDRILTSVGHYLHLWDGKTGRPLTPPMPHTDEIRAIGFSRDGLLAVSACLDKTTRLWDAATGELAANLNGGITTFTCLAIAPDGRRIAAGGWVNALSWELPASSGSVEQTMTLSRILSCERLDAGGNAPLTQDDIDADWKTLRDQNAPWSGTLAPLSVSVLRQTARMQLKKGRFREAEQTLDQALRLAGSDLESYYLRSDALAGQQNYAGALKNFERIAVLKSDPAAQVWEYALLCLAKGDSARYRAFAREMFSLHKNRKEEDCILLRYLTYAPGGVADYAEPLALVQKATDIRSKDTGLQYLLTGLLYRDGRYAETIRQQKNIPHAMSEYPETIVDEACSLLFVAMAQARMKQAAPAREALDQAQQIRARFSGWWRHCLEIDLLTKEAQNVLRESGVSVMAATAGEKIIR